LKERKNIALFFCGLLMVALIFSPFLLSISMISLLILGLVDWETNNFKKTISFNNLLVTRVKQYKNSASFLIITLYLFIVFFSAWQTEGDWTYWMERMRIKLPFLALPIAFLGLPRFDDRAVKGLLYFLLIFMTIISIGVGINYGLHFDEINNLISRGKPMPVPRNHIRFSILMSVAIIGGIYLISTQYFYKNIVEKSLIKGITIFLFLFIHILSVKTGIVCLYVALGVLSLRYIYTSQKYLIGLSVIIGLLSIPMIAFFTIPSFQQKINYAHYDLTQYLAGNGEKYADSGRITSLKVGWEIFSESPIFGTGSGNLKREVIKKYKKKYPGYEESLLPHNQFLYVLAGMGIFGFALFLLALFFPLFYKKPYRNSFFMGYYWIFITAFILEHTIENAVGVGTFTFFLLLFLNHLQKSLP